MILLNKTKADLQDDQIAADDGRQYYEGYTVDLLILIANMYGFKYKVQPVKDKKYGSQENNGTWNGMIGEIIRGVRFFKSTLPYTQYKA